MHMRVLKMSSEEEFFEVPLGNIYFVWTFSFLVHFPDGSVGKESTCNTGDPGSIPGLGRSPGEWIGYPLQYSWVSLVAQLVKNPPAMWETWVQSLGWEDPLGVATHSSILAWRIPWTVQSMGSQRAGHSWATFTFMFLSSRLYSISSHCMWSCAFTSLHPSLSLVSFCLCVCLSLTHTYSQKLSFLWLYLLPVFRFAFDSPCSFWLGIPWWFL